MNKYLTTSVLATALFSSSVFADSNFYLGASVGQSEVDYGEGQSFVTDDKDTSLEIFGGYKFSENLAVELAYQDFGENTAFFSGDTLIADGYAFSLSLVGALPVNEKLSVYGKLGVAHAEADANGQNTFIRSSVSDDDFLYGVGLTYGLTESVDLRFEWEHIDTFYEVDTLSLGVSYNF